MYPIKRTKGLNFDGPMWHLAARYLRHLLENGTPAERRAAYLRLREEDVTWANFIMPDTRHGDALARVVWQSPPQAISGWCIATIATAGYAQQLDDLFTTLERSGNIGDCTFAVIVVDVAPDVLEIAAKHNSLVVHCSSRARVNVATKAALYSITQVLAADFYLCLDTDILCVGALDELRAQVLAAPGRIVGAMSFSSTGAADRPRDLKYVTRHYYWGDEKDAAWLNGSASTTSRTTCSDFLRLNAGVFAGDHAAMMALNAELHSMAPRAMPWIESGICYAADELAFSVAVAQIGGVSECSTRYNWLMYAQDAQWRDGGFWSDETQIALLHFAAGEGKAKLPEYRKMLGL